MSIMVGALVREYVRREWAQGTLQTRQVSGQLPGAWTDVEFEKLTVENQETNNDVGLGPP